MDLKNILEVNTAEIIENILQIKLKGMVNTYYTYSLTYDKSYLVVIDERGNIIDARAISLYPTEKEYLPLLSRIMCILGPWRDPGPFSFIAKRYLNSTLHTPRSTLYARSTQKQEILVILSIPPGCFCPPFCNSDN